MDKQQLCDGGGRCAPGDGPHGDRRDGRRGTARTKQRCARGLAASPRWIACTLAVVISGCSFPRPEDVPGDAAPGEDAASSMVCMHDQDCSAEAPFCVDSACSPCQAACPDSAPICDPTSHACRGCNKDSECDSGACDLAAASCVSQGSILYASPNGINADDCTRGSPCPFDKAAASVDAVHPYIVLTPGIYSHGGLFDGKTATICGSGATFVTISAINMNHNASVHVRNLKFRDPAAAPVFRGTGQAIIVDNELTLDDVDMAASSMVMIVGGSSITIRTSTFAGVSSTIFTGMNITGHVVIDRSTFSSCGIFFNGSSPQDLIEISNSIFAGLPFGDSTRPSIQFNETSDTTSPGGALIYNNTFKGGSINCNGVDSSRKPFTSNIFYNTGTLSGAAGCSYNNSLVYPGQVIGNNNVSGDPLFVDAANNDFHLGAQSPAIDADISAQVDGHDFDRTTRPQGRRNDIGAFEYIPPPAPPAPTAREH